MRVTWDNRVDLDLSAQATCADIAAYVALIDTTGVHGRGNTAYAGATAMDDVWCGSVRLDPDHRAGVPPLVHGASLQRGPGTPAVRLTDPHLAVTCGPDAGHMVPLTREGVTIGRGEACDVTLADGAVSTDHARAGCGNSPWVRDAGSRNGTVLRRVDGTRTRSRRLRPRAGEHLLMGGSVAEVRPRPTEDGVKTRLGPRASASQLSAMGAGALTGIMLAVMTGRWYFALLALGYPLILGVPMLAQWLRRREDDDENITGPVDPCPSVGPPVAPIAGPVAVVGPAPLATATARSVVLAQQLRPHGDEWDEPWMRWLPRATREQTVMVMPVGHLAPSWAGTVVEIHGEETHVLTGTVTRVARRCEISEHTADELARLIASTRAAESLPDDVAWADLAPDNPTRPGRTLSTPIGVGAAGTVSLDLDHHGPHFLVAGTTGSGKSALLETLVLGLAHRHSPADLTVVLIDFKGGAGLRHCMDLPHVVGCLTDLDAHLAERALVALSAELEHRKREVAHAGYGSLGEWELAGGAPPRLLVVADEYQEIAQHHRDFLPHVARLAAQGRSLGLHLVLATQRPAGAVTPEIRANVSTTVALRVASAAESQDLLGTADAASLPASRPGRAIVAHGADHVPVQVAQPTLHATAPVRPAGQVATAAPAELAQATVERWQGVDPPGRLWRDPLPRHVALPPPLDNGGRPMLTLGLADWPVERRQEFVGWQPSTGPIAFIGPRGSGRTVALELLRTQAHLAGLTAVTMPTEAREAARTVVLTHDRDDVLLLVDDAGGALATLAEVDLGAPAELLLRRLSRGLPTAIALATHDPARLVSSAGTRMVFSGADATDDALWNVPRALSGRPALAGRGRLGAHGQWCEVHLCLPHEHTAPADRLVEPLPAAAEVARRCAADPRLLAVGGDHARPIHLPVGPVTVVGAPSGERDAAIAHVERVISTTVTVRDDLISFPGSTRPAGTVVLVQPTSRTVRDACGTAHIGLVEPTPRPGRVVIVSESGVEAAQFPG
ncbi:FtsK/SpoIIIE domain-containing protein [Demequina aurantiaca]|uniref:FtsK/SpoIIIE domain-containing protein n=1 Tax=Demequina aurantiaca TaxID=676200 RepID=UPI000A58E023|nr:FtsK/SpoIIIE domain-containing protein [Demequina aurantiaca]